MKYFASKIFFFPCFSKEKVHLETNQWLRMLKEIPTELYGQSGVTEIGIGWILKPHHHHQWQTYESMCLDLKRMPVQTSEVQIKYRIIIDSNILE